MKVSGKLADPKTKLQLFKLQAFAHFRLALTFY